MKNPTRVCDKSCILSLVLSLVPFPYASSRTYKEDGRVHVQDNDDHTTDKGHHVAGLSEGVRQEEYTGTDRALQQMHQRGEVPATIFFAYNTMRSFCLFIVTAALYNCNN